ncbi:MAG: hypothetical protein A3C03_02135 [Candidatus Colwellbacteria bacterium RIFCSPHIGHO2_02_FULL_45_17]|uniref:DUF192 domain-containing protein n=2 Tax=Candidatus Colwelliibacteriota TaxID=1817904 RepID=A0A1G1ZDZ6_9BACT|nr:MAG: hypothetical protein A3C03_02135 [Candidatus Colwellbacteria bacterium RIFCSPHIGHO2_02_FULL_45_17]OGY60867.1 MAG: hypothetical protein A3I33_01560 [Candidatus Colwellbacteria bacterium RIFCSPLOWO2_02_FULL_45_11]OGY62639.1 MAG: hypothetical protein A3G58_00935 [Candidatus Colwellbacteria bacterium RIFCSPLOWO2_12_FULL_46_17]
MFRGFEIWILIIPVVIVATAAYFYSYALRDVGLGKIAIGDYEFDVDIADTIVTRQQGLSGRHELGDKEGMLFIFERAALRRFWMKDMLIPIDIIWINDGEVVGFEENVEPEPGVPLQGLVIYKSPIPVSLVLEVEAGTVNRTGIKSGDPVSIRL